MAIAETQLGLTGLLGGLNVYQGAKEGDFRQAVGGTRQALGAYTAANAAMTQRAFEQGLTKATEMGLSGTAATQYANTAAEGAGLAGAQSVGQWLPWLGTGLAVYNALTGKIHGGDQALAAASFASMPWTGPLGFGAGAFFTLTKMLFGAGGSAHDKHVYFHEPDLELIHKDEEGNYYLYDHNADKSHPGGSKKQILDAIAARGNSKGQGSLIKFNPEKNEMFRANIGIKAEEDTTKDPIEQRNKYRRHTILSLDQAKELFTTGKTTHTWTKHQKRDRRNRERPDVEITDTLYLNAETEEQRAERRTGQKYGQKDQLQSAFLNWSNFSPETKYSYGGRSSFTRYNMSALQSQLYNKVLLPENLAPQSQWESATIGGKQYQVDPSGVVADADGKLIGSTDRETGQVNSFEMPNKARYHSDGSLDISGDFSLGTIDNWNQIKNTISVTSPTPQTAIPGLTSASPGGDGLIGMLKTMENSSSVSKPWTGGFNMGSDGSINERKEQVPAQREEFQQRLMDSLMSTLFPGGKAEGLESWMKANWEAKKRVGGEYLGALEGESSRRRALQEPIANRGTAVSLGNLSMPFTTGTQRRAQNILAGINDAEAKAKALYGERYEIPYGPETEYFQQVTSPMTQWAENLAWGLPSTHAATSVDMPDPSFVSKATDLGQGALGLTQLLNAIGGTGPGKAVGGMIGDAVTGTGGWLSGLLGDASGWMDDLLSGDNVSNFTGDFGTSYFG